jgi:hypothetical protein
MRVGLAVLVLLVPGVAWATITPASTATRSSGTAPLAVFFDATGTTDSDATVTEFTDLQYEWGFADSLGNWAVSGVSKAGALGPIAGHVFEPSSYPDNCGAGANTCKQYSVTMTARGQSAAVAATPLTISVTSPDTTWASTTVCVSTTADFTGCPAVGSHVTDAGNWQTVVANRLAAGSRRVLFHSAQTWTQTAAYVISTAGPGLIGTFDAEGMCSANNPCSSRAIVSYTPTSGDAIKFNEDDWRLTDLDLQGPGSGTPHAIRFEQTKDADGVTYNTGNTALRLNMQGYLTGFITPDSAPINDVVLEEAAIVENTFSSSVSGSSGNCAYLNIGHTMILGNDFDRDGGLEHVLRLSLAEKVVASHNRLADPEAAKHHIKLHSHGATAGLISDKVVISSNTLTGGLNDWMLAVGPTADDQNELVEEVLVERNYLVAGTAMQMGVLVWARNVTVRNNVIDMALATGTSPTGVFVDKRGTTPTAGVTNNQVYNNTCYSAASSGTARCVWIANDAVTSTVYNNLIYDIGAGASAVLLDQGTGTVTATNTDASGGASPFVGPLSSPQGFRLTTGHAYLNAGTTVPHAKYADFGGILVPQGSGSPLGAWESQPSGPFVIMVH